MFVNCKEDNKKIIAQYFKDINEDYAEGYSDFYISSDMSLDSFYFVIEENKVKAGFNLLYTTELTGEKISTAGWLLGGFDKYLDVFKKQFPDTLICLGSYYDWTPYEAAGYTKTLSNSSFVESYEYRIEPFAVPHNNPYIIRDYYESKMFPDVNIEDISFEVWNRKAVRDHVDSIRMEWIGEPYWGEAYSSVSVVGFHYLGGTDLRNDDNEKIKYLVAKCGKTIVGIVKFGIFGCDSHQSVAYIDVNAKYRQRGIAKKMAKALNENLFPDVELHLTDESQMGEICKMAKYFKESITSVPCFTYREIMNRVYA